VNQKRTEKQGVGAWGRTRSNSTGAQRSRQERFEKVRKKHFTLKEKTGLRGKRKKKRVRTRKKQKKQETKLKIH